MIFFVVCGFIIPAFENVQYYFLIDKCAITQGEYSFLNMCQSIGLAIGIMIYLFWLKTTEVSKVITISLVCNVFMTLLQLANFYRLNLKIGINDFYFNLFLMLFGRATTISLSVLPMTIMMMYVIPKNIEASMFSLITGTLTFSTDWGGDMIGAFLCSYFGITDDNMSKFDQVLLIKVVCVFVCILLVRILPTN